MKIFSAFFAVCGVLAAQVPNPTQQSVPVNAGGSMPVYRVTVVSRSTKAINYRNRGGATKIDFRGTTLLPKANGEAKVESKQGYIEIEVEFDELSPATAFGPEYLTYVMWAITPEGRANNLGEVLLNGNRSKLNVSTELQSFGLIVTAEPYYAVTQPSDVVVMENVLRKDTIGAVQEVDAKYELLKRGSYTLNVNPADLKPMRLDKNVPLELYEARNAVQIARWAGAEKYAGDTFLKATKGLSNAEGYLARKAGKKPIVTVSREAVQMAEDARIITIKKMAEESLANERQASAERELKAEAGQRSAAAGEAAAQSETDRIKRDAEAARAAAQSEADRMKRDAETARLAAQSEAERVKRETDAQRAAAQSDIERAGREKAEAEAARAAAVLAQQAAQSETEKARLAVGEADQLRLKAEAEKAELRAQLLRQFSLVLETRDTARGLIVNMSDVLFDSGKYSLRSGAREKLAKVAGIISGHPGLKLEVEGHTDNIGGDDYNQKLSEQRGGAVRDYLTQQGIATASVTSEGFGKTRPVVSNDTSAGRQQNRRVELVVSGEIIGGHIGSPRASR